MHGAGGEYRNHEGGICLLYTVGQLSKHTGVSIRTLHYYEKLGLLRPARNENNQYRLYGEKDILRLQQITILKKMHFKLNEIGEFLDQDAARSEPESTLTLWNNTLEQQLAVVKEQQERLSKVEHLLFQPYMPSEHPVQSVWMKCWVSSVNWISLRASSVKMFLHMKKWNRYL